MEALVNQAWTHILPHLLVLGGLYLLVSWMYRPSLHGPFLWDDLYLLASRPSQYLNPLVKAQHPVLFFLQYCRLPFMGRTMEFIHNRPLTLMTYAMDAKRYGLDTSGWHKTSQLIHWVGACLTYSLLLRLDIPWPSAVLGACIFLAYPMSSMAVGYIAGRSSLLCGVLILASISCAMFGGWWGWGGAVLSLVLALLSKEEAVVGVGILAFMLLGGLAR